MIICISVYFILKLEMHIFMSVLINFNPPAWRTGSVFDRRRAARLRSGQSTSTAGGCAFDFERCVSHGFPNAELQTDFPKASQAAGDMVIQQAVCVNARIISLRCGLKVFEKFLPVTFAFEDSFALIST